MVSLAGLSAVYPGMQAAQKQSTQNDMQDLQLQDQQYANAGKQALGKVFQQMVPGAQGFAKGWPAFASQYGLPGGSGGGGGSWGQNNPGVAGSAYYGPVGP